MSRASGRSRKSLLDGGCHEQASHRFALREAGRCRAGACGNAFFTQNLAVALFRNAHRRHVHGAFPQTLRRRSRRGNGTFAHGKFAVRLRSEHGSFSREKHARARQKKRRARNSHHDGNLRALRFLHERRRNAHSLHKLRNLPCRCRRTSRKTRRRAHRSRARRRTFATGARQNFRRPRERRARGHRELLDGNRRSRRRPFSAHHDATAFRKSERTPRRSARRVDSRKRRETVFRNVRAGRRFAVSPRHRAPHSQTR